MTTNSRFVVIGIVIGAIVGFAMTAVTHRPEMCIPLGIGVGMVIGVAIRDRRNQELGARS
jgi:uncharacterized membrane protein YoaK (UPF0700 family)